MCYFYLIWNKITLCQILVKIANMKFRVNLYSGNHPVPYGSMDMTRLMVAFGSQFVNVPKKRSKFTFFWYN